MARKAKDKKVVIPGPLEIVFGTGVMDKCGKEPYALKTFMVEQASGWNTPVDYSVFNVFAALASPDTIAFQVIDEQNRQFTVKVRERTAKETADMAERREALTRELEGAR